MPSVYPLKSKKKLFEFLGEWFDDQSFPEQGLKRAGVDNETYDRDSHIYLYLKQASDASKLRSTLTRNGFKVNYDYDPEKVVDVQVSYFKGIHWDE